MTIPVARAVRVRAVDLAADLAVPSAADELSVLHGVGVLLVEGPGFAALSDPPAAAGIARLPTVTVAVLGAAVGDADVSAFDVVVPDGPWPLDDTLDALVGTCTRAPRASLALVQLLRRRCWLGPDDLGLWAESVTYGVLQASSEFRRWHRTRTGGRAPDEDDRPVRVHVEGATTHVVLHRPWVRNAIDVATRDALVETFDALAWGSGPVVLAGAGPSFCAGGDRSEFGTTRDAALAHAVRSAHLPARSLARIADRTTARIHGAAVGAGIELAAWCRWVEADPAAFVTLPEVTMGLVPGAGGTVSIPRRIGAQRTNLLALTGHRLDAASARAWGLVDAVTPLGPARPGAR